MTTTITVADKAINATYSAPVETTTSAHGTGAAFDVTKTNGVYAVTFDSATGSDGTGYIAGDTITIQGSLLGGVNGTNDLIITVGTVGTGGKIATFGAVGTGRVGDGIVDVQIDVTGTAGVDTYSINGKSTDYTVTKSATAIVADSLLDTHVEFSLANHERVVFTDKAKAWDSNAQTVYGLLAAGLGVGGVTRAYEGIGISLADNGMSELNLAQSLIGTSVFQTAAGMISATDNSDFVKFVYTNVMGVAPTVAQAKTYTDMLDAHSQTQASLLVAAAHLTAFDTIIGLVGIAQPTPTGVLAGGIEYTPVV